ncbi:uncharacterized protein BKA78DRAFT_189014 [Phyllosticta capitalensis]|uniref:uncharacterized protein n=1 Tax=Phyllosticta capitalensis TaxID=121624 RepID=UPI00313172F8
MGLTGGFTQLGASGVEYMTKEMVLSYRRRGAWMMVAVRSHLQTLMDMEGRQPWRGTISSEHSSLPRITNQHGGKLKAGTQTSTKQAYSIHPIVKRESTLAKASQLPIKPPVLPPVSPRLLLQVISTTSQCSSQLRSSKLLMIALVHPRPW